MSNFKNDHIHTCPICKKELKHLLTHIQTNVKDEVPGYKELLEQQTQVAQQLYDDKNYNTQTYENYNLLLNYNEYAQIWYKTLNLEKRASTTPMRQLSIKCPQCHKSIDQSHINQHFAVHHPEFYQRQVNLVKQLFYDYNFSEYNIEQYSELYLKMSSIYKIWQETYTKEERQQRSKLCNAARQEKIQKGKTFTDKQRAKLSQAQINYRSGKHALAMRGVRPDIGHFAASTYEANIYRIFQLEKKVYKRETENVFPITFPNGEKHNYIVDICDVDGLFDDPGTYIEVKGYMDEKSLLKINCFKEQYPQYKLIVIGNKYQNNFVPDIDYKDLEIKYQVKLPLWETSKDNIKTNPKKWNMPNPPEPKCKMHCPICGDVAGQRIYTHIQYYHPELYKKLYQYIKDLFYDNNFKITHSKDNSQLYGIGQNTIVRIWVKEYGQDKVSNRDKILGRKK